MNVPSSLRALALLAAGCSAGVAFVLSCGSGPADSEAEPTGTTTTTSATSSGSGGPTLIVTADSDPGQLSSGTVSCSSDAEVLVLDGPFVLTDAMTSSPTGATLGDCNGRFIAKIGPEAATFNGTTYIAQGNRPDIHGARIFVPSGESLCVFCYEAAQLSFSGFTPYGE